MENTEIYVSHVLDTNSGFGARTDTGEQVFIPASVTKASGAAEGDILTAKIIPNTHPNNMATPWVAVHVSRQEQSINAGTESVSVDKLVLKSVCALGYGTTAEISHHAGSDTTATGNALSRLFKDGTIAKALVYARDGQDRASLCMWGKDTMSFLGDTE